MWCRVSEENLLTHGRDLFQGFDTPADAVFVRRNTRKERYEGLGVEDRIEAWETDYCIGCGKTLKERRAISTYIKYVGDCMKRHEKTRKLSIGWKGHINTATGLRSRTMRLFEVTARLIPMLLQTCMRSRTPLNFCHDVTSMRPASP